MAVLTKTSRNEVSIPYRRGLCKGSSVVCGGANADRTKMAGAKEIFKSTGCGGKVAFGRYIWRVTFSVSGTEDPIPGIGSEIG